MSIPSITISRWTTSYTQQAKGNQIIILKRRTKRVKDKYERHSFKRVFHKSQKTKVL